jgi:rfaE bifunctional protein kinase chain/domain
MLSIEKNLIKNPFLGVKVAVLGDVMMDCFMYGDVERISPEAPVPVVKVTKKNAHLGGAGNVVANLSSLGAKPIMIGRIGDDPLGVEFEKMSQKMGIETKFLLRTSLPTISKTRVIARSQQVVRFDEEETGALSNHDRQRILTVLEEARKETSTLIVSDYSKGMVDDKMLNDIKKVWQGGAIFIDPKPKGVTRNQAYIQTTTMTPNAQEASELLGCDKPKTDDEAAMMAEQLVEKFDLEYVLLTRSGDGMTLYDGQNVHHLKSKVQEVVDVSGAGDTVISIFAASIASGMKVEEAAHFANVSGGVVVAKLGTVTATWEDMQKAMQKYIDYHKAQIA